MKKIFMLVPNGYHAANMLRTGILEILKKSNLQIIILSPLCKKIYFRQEFQDSNVELIDQEVKKPSLLFRLFLALRNLSFLDPDFTQTLKIKNGKRRLVYLLAKIGHYFLHKLRLSENFWDNLERLIFENQDMEFLFKNKRPSLVITPTPGLQYSEIPILVMAKKYDVPVAAIDTSWDNLTGKLALARRVNRLILWNEIMKREAIYLHRLSPGVIKVSGNPRFDIYFQKNKLISRKKFFQEINADPEKKLITLTTTRYVTYPYHPEIIEILKEAIKKKKFNYPVQLLLRLHPRDNFAIYQKFKNQSDIIIESPGRMSLNVQGHPIDPTLRDMLHLANLLRYSDVIVNVSSTITVEACIFDTSVINIGFDGYRKKDYYHSVRRYYDFTHYQNIIRAKGVRMSYSPSQLIDLISLYLKNPSLDRIGRKEIVQKQCYKTDGQSAQRIAKYILDFLKEIDEKKNSSSYH